jgi:hypothetical protein
VGADRLAEFTEMAARQLGAVYPDVFPNGSRELLRDALVHEFKAGTYGCMATNLVVVRNN